MLVLLVFLVSLIFRLVLTPLGFHVDIYSNAGWGQWIYTHGPLGFMKITFGSTLLLPNPLSQVYCMDLTTGFMYLF